LGSCQGVRTFAPNAPDGDYLLFNNGRLITVYCADMSTAPKEYIDLGRTGPNVNFSQYTAGGASPGTSVRTTFTKLRIDPATLKADSGDRAFAASAGSLLHSGSVQVRKGGPPGRPGPVRRAGPGCCRPAAGAPPCAPAAGLTGQKIRSSRSTASAA